MTGVGMEIHVQDDDRDIRRALRRLQRWSGGDMLRTFRAIGSHLEDSTRLRFEAETDPEGAPWKPSAPSYERGPDKLGHADRGKTLQDTSRLVRSFTHAAHRDRSETGTNVVYAPPHQFGARTPPRTIRPLRKKALAWPGARHPVKSVQHPGSTMPRRAFLGASRNDRRRIVAITERHLAEMWR